MAQPPGVAQSSLPLRRAYQEAWRRIEAEQQQALADDPRAFRRRARLREIQQEILAITTELDDVARAWTRAQLPKIYGMGAHDAARALRLRVSFTEIDRVAVQGLASDLMGDLLAATKHVNQTTKRLIREAVRSETLQAAITGGTLRDARRRVVDLLERKGIHAVRYSNGAKWGLDKYADMAVRTKSALAYNLGGLNGSQEVPFWECFDGPGCGLTSHDDPQTASGLILPREQALSYPIAHPNCQRSWGPRPDIRTKAEARRAQPTEPPPAEPPPRDMAEERAARLQAKRQARDPLRRRERKLERREKMLPTKVPSVDDPLLKRRIDRVVSDAIKNESGITSSMREIEAASGGRLAGLEFRLKANPASGQVAVEKSALRLRQKVVADLEDALRAGQQRTVSDAVANLKDPVRYTFVFPDGQYVAGVERAKSLFADRYDKVKFENLWGPKSKTYQGLNAAFQDRVSGQVFEVQFHTPRSLAAKKPSHPWYEIWRDPDRQVADRKVAKRHILDIWRPITRDRPAGVERITWQ